MRVMTPNSESSALQTARSVRLMPSALTAILKGGQRKPLDQFAQRAFALNPRR